MEKLKKAETSKARPRAGELTPSNVDEEFGEFFNQGDTGEYEGGVAYTQPPPTKLPAEEDEWLPNSDPTRRRARRAFFARVVAGIITACVALLVTAARFRPQDSKKAGGANIGLSSVQKEESSSSKQSVRTSEPKALAPPPAPEVTDPETSAPLDNPTMNESATENDEIFRFCADCQDSVGGPPCRIRKEGRQCGARVRGFVSTSAQIEGT